MGTGPISEQQKKELSRKVGKDLVEHHGKKKYYSKGDVDTSLGRVGASVDWSCWCYALFLCHDDFDVLHAATGEVCDYLSMRASMVSAFTDHVSDSWLNFDFDLSWIEFPDFDISSILDVFD